MFFVLLSSSRNAFAGCGSLYGEKEKAKQKLDL